MKKFIDENDIATEVRMIFSVHKGVVLIVEGPSDYKLYRKFFNEKSCLITIAQGKDNVTGAQRILNNNSISHVFSIVDADFWHILNAVPSIPNLFVTDLHDIETMMFISDDFNQILREHASEGKLSSFDGEIRRHLVDKAVIVGAFRLCAHIESVPFSFRDINFGDFTAKSDLSISIDKLIMSVSNRSQLHGIDIKAWESKISAALGKGYDPLQLCCGHDIVNLLSLALRSFIGSCAATDISQEKLEKDLRLAYSKSSFAKSALSRNIHGWITANGLVSFVN